MRGAPRSAASLGRANKPVVAEACGAVPLQSSEELRLCRGLSVTATKRSALYFLNYASVTPHRPPRVPTPGAFGTSEISEEAFAFFHGVSELIRVLKGTNLFLPVIAASVGNGRVRIGFRLSQITVTVISSVG